jgi:hypothetical protein
MNKDTEWASMNTQTTTMTRLTTLEREVLDNLFASSHRNGHDFGFIEDHGIDARQARAIVVSLQKKEIIHIHEAMTTDSGTWTQFTWAKEGIYPQGEATPESVEDIIS